MDIISLLTVIAFLLMAVSMSSRDESPWTMLAGIGLLGICVLSRLFGGGGFFAILVPLFFDTGLSLLVAAVWLRVRKSRANPQPFLALGVLSLAAAGLLFALSLLLNVLNPSDRASLLVELGPDDHIEEIAGILERHDAAAERAFPTLDLATDEDLAQVWLVHGDAQAIDALIADLSDDTENVDHVEVNVSVSVTPIIPSTQIGGDTRQYLENDPYVGEQWALQAIRGHEAHALLSELSPVRKARVAILDTGIEGNHEDLKDVLDASSGSSDEHGHGTHCAGIAGAATNNRIGVASLNWNGEFIELTAYRALGDDGVGSLESIAQAIVDATQADADVISMSLGSVAPVAPRVLVKAVGFAHRNGAIVAASAGNSNQDASNHFPSNIEGVYAIAAVDQNLQKATFSNTVGALSRPLAAPGVDILSSYPGSTYKPLSGTSMATPVTTGLLGVMRALAPDLSSEDAYSIVHETGTTVDHTPQVGRVINAEAAIVALLKRSS